jgi:hypothetical protein
MPKTTPEGQTETTPDKRKSMKTAEEYLTEHLFRHYRKTFGSDERL